MSTVKEEGEVLKVQEQFRQALLDKAYSVSGALRYCGGKPATIRRWLRRMDGNCSEVLDEFESTGDLGCLLWATARLTGAYLAESSVFMWPQECEEQGEEELDKKGVTA